MKELHIYNVDFFDKYTTTGWISVDGATQAAEFGTLISIERRILWARSKWVVTHDCGRSIEPGYGEIGGPAGKEGIMTE